MGNKSFLLIVSEGKAADMTCQGKWASLFLQRFLPGQLAQGITFFLKHKIQQKGSSSFNPKKGGSNEEGKERKQKVCLVPCEVENI